MRTAEELAKIDMEMRRVKDLTSKFGDFVNSCANGALIQRFGNDLQVERYGFRVTSTPRMILSVADKPVAEYRFMINQIRLATFYLTAEGKLYASETNLASGLSLGDYNVQATVASISYMVASELLDSELFKGCYQG